jgi:hypothetical protein
MKTFLTAVCALAVGAAVGAFCMHAYDAKELYTETLHGIQQVGQERATCIGMNLLLLQTLEADGSDRAKSVLARLVASYYRTWHDFQPMGSETRKLMDHIQATSETSPSLKAALDAPPK